MTKYGWRITFCGVTFPRIRRRRRYRRDPVGFAGRLVFWAAVILLVFICSALAGYIGLELVDATGAPNSPTTFGPGMLPAPALGGHAR